MIDYDKLNDILHNEITNSSNQIFLNHLDEIVKLAQIIIKSEEELVKIIPKYHTHVDINTSIQCVTEFFHSIKPEYADMFQNILRERLVDARNREEEYSVRFHHTTNESNGYVNDEGSVGIEYNETVEDIYSISHELIHKFSQPKLKYKGIRLGNESIIKSGFGEGTTITVEFLLQDYLKMKYGMNEEFKIYKQQRLLDSTNNAWGILFEHVLLHLYKENGNHVDKEILKMYVENLPKSSEEYKTFSKLAFGYIKDILAENSLLFKYDLRYVIGTLLASHLHKQIKENSANMEKLVYLIDILGHANHEVNHDLEELYKLGIPIIDKKGINVTDESYKQLEEAYLQEVADSKIQSSHKKL